MYIQQTSVNPSVRTATTKFSSFKMSLNIVFPVQAPHECKCHQAPSLQRLLQHPFHRCPNNCGGWFVQSFLHAPKGPDEWDRNYLHQSKSKRVYICFGAISRQIAHCLLLLASLVYSSVQRIDCCPGM
jgi:hypothetical protein